MAPPPGVRISAGCRGEAAQLDRFIKYLYFEGEIHKWKIPENTPLIFYFILLQRVNLKIVIAIKIQNYKYDY